MNFAKFTRDPDNAPVLVNLDLVVAVTPACEGVSVLCFTEEEGIRVRSTVDELAKLLVK